jgi:hypothetical protein
VVERYEFESIYHAQMIFSHYYEWNNNYRKHGSLGRKSPEQFLLQYAQKNQPCKTENYPKLSQILTPFCPRTKGSIQNLDPEPSHIIFKNNSTGDRTII